MPNLGSVINMLKYAPTVLGIVKQFRGQQQSAAVADEVVNTRHSLEDFKRTTLQRLDDLEKENSRLRSRLKDADAAITLLKAMIWAIAAFALVAFVLALLALIRLSFMNNIHYLH